VADKKELNEWEKAYIAEIRKCLADGGLPNDDDGPLTEAERYLLENEIGFIEEGTISFTGPQTLEERIWRLRNHFP
jgi:hypothetical protein